TLEAGSMSKCTMKMLLSLPRRPGRHWHRGPYVNLHASCSRRDETREILDKNCGFKGEVCLLNGAVGPDPRNSVAGTTATSTWQVRGVSGWPAAPCSRESCVRQGCRTHAPPRAGGSPSRSRRVCRQVGTRSLGRAGGTGKMERNSFPAGAWDLGGRDLGARDPVIRATIIERRPPGPRAGGEEPR